MTAEYGADYTAYQLQRSGLRRLVRRAYLHRARSFLQGPTLDFGCGIGELLQLLPSGSVGLEYNKATVQFCRQSGLDVRWYDGEADGWALTPLGAADGLKSMVVSHVLEHLDEPMGVLGSLMRAARRLGIERILVVVPGPAGFRLDPTHRTLVDLAMLVKSQPGRSSGFSLSRAEYFPVDWKAMGRWFPHHELQALFVLEPAVAE
jgi:SAM-dependent methyltransferase